MKKQYDIIGNRKRFFLFSTVLIVFILCQKQIYGGLAAGAVKG